MLRTQSIHNIILTVNQVCEKLKYESTMKDEIDNHKIMYINSCIIKFLTQYLNTLNITNKWFSIQNGNVDFPFLMNLISVLEYTPG